VGGEEKITQDEDGNLVIQTGLMSELQGIRSDIAGGFGRMEGNLHQLDGRVRSLEAWRHDREVAADVHHQRDDRERAGLTRRQKIWGGVGVVAVIVATVVGPILGATLH